MRGQRICHILGAGQWQVPTIAVARSLGYRTFVSDIYPDRPGYAHADEHAVMDIRDEQGTLLLAEEHRIDGIICDTTDAGVPTMAFVAERLGLPGIGYETALNFTNKYRMRALTSAAGVPNPPFRLVRALSAVRSAAADIGFPCVVKPVDNQSSRGVHVVRTPSDLDVAYADALRFTRSAEVLVEGFLGGVEVTVESMCVDGEVLAIGISDKDHFAHRPEVAKRLTYPADLPAEVMERIRAINATVVCTLGMKTGITHAEYIVVNGQPYLVEIAARGAGSRVYSHIVPYLAGSLIPEMYLKFLMGDSPALPARPPARAANLAFFGGMAGLVKSIHGVEQALQLPGVQEILLEFQVGDSIELPADDRSRPGLVVVFGKSRGEVLRITEEVFRTVQVGIE